MARKESNSIYKFNKVVSEISSFVGNPVDLRYFMNSVGSNNLSLKNQRFDWKDVGIRKFNFVAKILLRRLKRIELVFFLNILVSCNCSKLVYFLARFSYSSLKPKLNLETVFFQSMSRSSLESLPLWVTLYIRIIFPSIKFMNPRILRACSVQIKWPKP